MIRHALISACDAAIITMFAACVLAYAFRWPLCVLLAASIIAKAL